MRLLVLITLASITLVNQPSFSDQPESSPKVAPIKEITHESVDLSSLPLKSEIGSLSDYTRTEDTLLDALKENIWPRSILAPYAESLAYVNGYLSHVGYYPRSVIYTILEGPQYGLQLVMTYEGITLYVNFDYQMEYAPGGIIFHHYYDDSEIITGSNQVISFY